MENKFPALLTCIDFSLLHLPPSSPTLAGAVAETLAWVGSMAAHGSGGSQSPEWPANTALSCPLPGSEE